MENKFKPEQKLQFALDQIKNRTSNLSENPLELLTNLVKAIRPLKVTDTGYSIKQFADLNKALQSDSTLLLALQELISEVFKNANLLEVLTLSGIIEESGFFSELKKRIDHRFLPPVKKEGNFLSIIDSVFYKSNDYQWVNELPEVVWLDFFETLDLELDIKNEKIRKQAFKSLELVGYQLSALSVAKPIRQSCDSIDKLDPFCELSRIIQKIILTNGQSQEYEDLKTELSKKLYECEQLIAEIKRKSFQKGTSVRQSHTLMQLSQYINRVHLIISLLGNNLHVDYKRIVSQLKALIENENTKNYLGRYLRQTLSSLAYRIAEHGRNTGEHYITSTRKEYGQMFKSASKGGLIVSFVVLIKTLLHAVKFAPFWQGFAYSVNYATGFIFIHATGSTLATKQPAMTASAIASTIDRKDRHVNMAKLAILISKIIRSQTVSFIGNLIIVFPVTLLIAILFDKVFGSPLANNHFAHEMLNSQNPIKSLCLLYACFTGFFLFISGLISGYFDNLVLYSKIPERIRKHPGLKRIFSTKTLNKIAGYCEKNLGAFMGNLSLGFFLGMASFVGYIFGLPFDIRHITISTGYYAIGLYTLFPNVSVSDIILPGIGVILIGFLNFLVSFSLAFYIALSSRKIHFNRYKSLGRYVRYLFKKYPKDFIYPPKKPRVVEDFLPKDTTLPTKQQADSLTLSPILSEALTVEKLQEEELA